MRTSSLGAALVVLAAASGCGIDPKVQFLFEDAREPLKTATRDWNGEPITIRNAGNDDGVNPPVTVGGVEVRVSPTATKISVEAVFAAWADADLASNAWASMADAKKTLQINESAAGFEIACGNGETHGTSRGASAGCKTLRVTLPAGTTEKPHALTVIAGSASLLVDVADSGGAPSYVRTVMVDNTGPSEVMLRLRPVKDASLSITGEGPVSVALPADFSARKIMLNAGSGGSPEADPGDFPGLTSGVAYPAAGASSEAAAELSVRSKNDTITLIRL